MLGTLTLQKPQNKQLPKVILGLPPICIQLRQDRKRLMILPHSALNEAREPKWPILTIIPTIIINVKFNSNTDLNVLPSSPKKQE